MTSRISSFKMHTEDMKHRVAMIVLSIFLFLMKDLFVFISLQNTKNSGRDMEDIQRLITDTVQSCTAAGVMHLLYILPLAALLAVQGYRYLHNKREVDFLHSLPMTRGELFRLIVTNDVLIFLIPYVISLLIQTGIVAIFRPLDMTYFRWMLEGSSCTILAFLACYLLMTLSMILTGQTFVALLAFGVFATYAPIVIRFLLQIYCSLFFETYSQLPSILNSILTNISPISMVTKLSMRPTGMRYIYAILWIVVLLLADYILYKKRASESAGTAMAFPRGQKLIKLLITIPMAMYTGSLFYGITMSRTMMWLYFGVIFGALLFHGLVECIYRTDIRGLWANKKEMLFFLLLSFLFVFGFEMDFVGYDSYVPKKENVSAVKIEQLLYGSVVNFGAGSPEDHGITGQDKDEILDALMDVRQNMSGEKEDDRNIWVSYTLNNRQTIYRRYYIKEEGIQKIGRALFEKKEYKEEIFPIFHRDTQNIISLSVEHPLKIQNLPITEKEEFISILREELHALTYEEASSQVPLCKLFIEYSFDDGKDADCSETYDIYPSFTRTIDYIEKHGGKVGADARGLSLDSLRINYYIDGDQYVERYITDKEYIESIADKLYYQDLNSNLFLEGKYDVNGDILGMVNGMTYYFRTDEKTFEELCNKVR